MSNRLRLKVLTMRKLGFSLIEVLVALVIISIGILGIAAMQASALAGTHSSQNETLAALQARSLADAMLANSAFWSSSAAPSSVVITPGSSSSSVTFSGAGAGAFSNYTDCTTSVCSATSMATYDLTKWGEIFFQQVPGNPNAVVSCNTGTLPPTCVIQLNWSQKATVAINAATTSTSATPAAATTVSYTLINQL